VLLYNRKTFFLFCERYKFLHIVPQTSWGPVNLTAEEEEALGVAMSILIVGDRDGGVGVAEIRHSRDKAWFKSLMVWLL